MSGRRSVLTRKGLLAIVFSILMVTGTIAPVFAMESSSGAIDQRIGDDQLATSILERDEVDTLTEGDPVLQKTWARLILTNSSELNAETDEEALAHLNDSIEYTDGSAHVSDPASFNHSAAAVDSLALSGEPEADEQRVLAAHLIVSADNETAAERIAEATWALNHTQEDLHTGVEQSATAHIQNAERAYERAQERSEAADEDDFDEQASAIQQYRIAWMQATKALNAIDAATSPEVTITTRGDPPRNGTESIKGEIRGTIFDVRPETLSEARVTIGDTETKIVPIETSDSRTNATFATNVTLDEQITSVEVEVVDPVSENEDDRNGKSKQQADGNAARNGNDRGAGGAPSGQIDKPQVGTDTVLFDGDGLPDTYETEIVGTDPKDPDSESPKVDEDIGDNGVIDGLEDFDDDNVTNYHEGRFDTDPFEPDTDGDGLPDHFEVQYPELDQTSADTRDDGVDDAEWDADDDGLTNYEEYEAGTNPLIADEDRDELNDSRELEIGTDPHDPDTDNDGLLDGVEVRLGTDPLTADSDGNGINDGEDTHTTSTSNESLGIDIDITGTGDLADGVTIKPNNEERFETNGIESASASPVIELGSEREFDQANITVEYDDTVLDDGDADELAVFRFNETTQTFEALPSTVDTQNGTITGETTQFSTFVVFHIPTWVAQFDATETGDGDTDDNVSETQPLDTMFVVDTSGSMGSNDPYGYRKDAAKRFVSALIDGDRAGVVDFDSYASVTQDLSGDFDAVNSSIDRLGASGGTNIGAGLQEANDHFDAESNDSRAKVSILLTDGVGSGGISEAEAAAERNITIYTIGFGSADESKLKRIADETDGEYHFVDGADDLPEVFSRVAENATDGLDTDGDGLPDSVEKTGVRTGWAEYVDTDPYAADTDGDGLDDGEEIERRVTVDIDRNGQQYNYTYYELRSDPSKVDSDGDGVDDYTETHESTTVVQTTDSDATNAVLETSGENPDAIDDHYKTYEVYSDPLAADTDGDGLDDGRERELATDPTARDTDGDDIDDEDELESAGDPTLYDAQPPEIDIQQSGYQIPERSLDTTYWVNVHIHDPAGVERAVLIKDGNEERTETYGGKVDVYDTLKFTEEFAESETDIDTSSVKSTFISFGSKSAETVGSVAESVGDTTAGTTIYLESSDTNANSYQIVGVQRANFYSEAAGGLYTGTLIDQAVASEFGTISGFSSSLGVAFQDVSQLIEDPAAVVEGIRALIALVAEERLGAGKTLVTAIAQNVEQTQIRNNPYGSLEEKEHPELYDTFEANWYEGYAAGFLAKTVLGGSGANSAKSAIKGTSSAQKVGSQLVDTKAARALSRASDAKDAAKARATARVLLATDGDAAEAMLSQADTAGGTYTLWRHQRAMDADVDALSETRQERLAQTLLRADGDGQSAIRQMDQDAIEELTELEITARTRARIAPKYANLDASQRSNLREIVHESGDKAATGSARLDHDSLEAVLDAGLSRQQKADVLETVDEAAIHSFGETAGGRDLAIRYLARGGDRDGDILNKKVCNSPCDGIADSVKRLDLGQDQEEYLLANLDAYEKRQSNLARPAAEVEADLDRLAKKEVEGLESAINHGTRNKKNPEEITDTDLIGFQGLDGEAEVAASLLDNDRHISEMEVDVDATIPGDGPTGSEIDIDLREESLGIEVKNRDYNTFYDNKPDFIRQSDKEDLVQKIEVVTRNRDTFVIAHKTDDVDNTIISEAIEEADIPDDTMVETKRIENIEEI